MRRYQINVASYYREAFQVFRTFLENAGAVVVSVGGNSISIGVIVDYAGDDFADVMNEIEETNSAGFHVFGFQEIVD